MVGSFHFRCPCRNNRWFYVICWHEVVRWNPGLWLFPAGQQVAILGGRLKAEVGREKKKEVIKQVGYRERHCLYLWFLILKDQTILWWAGLARPHWHVDSSGSKISASIRITQLEGLFKPTADFLIQKGWGEGREFVLLNKLPGDAAVAGPRLRTIGLEQEEHLCD